MGTLSTTVSGKRCQSWSSNTPHELYYGVLDDADYPDGSRAAAENFCRNPDSDPRGIWCYTTDPDTKWEFCNVPHCRGKCKNVDQ